MDKLEFWQNQDALPYYICYTALVIVALAGILAFLKYKAPRIHGYAGFLEGLLLACMAGLAVVAGWNYMTDRAYRYGSHLNYYEFYHYYIGSKYAKEVGYEGMYAASLIADKETGMKWANPKRSIRNLETGGYIHKDEVLNNAEKYKKNFSEARWEEFKQDIRWFKGNLVGSRWNGILRDKGYNATPIWTTIVGGLFSNNVSTQNELGMVLLSYLDEALIALALLSVLWAFGPWAMLIMVVLMGTSYVMHWWHMKGAYLRTDFTMPIVIAIAMLKKEHYKTAGALMGYAFLSRIFPAVFLFGLGAKFLWDIIPAVGPWLRATARRIGAANLSGLLIIAAGILVILFTGGWYVIHYTGWISDTLHINPYVYFAGVPALLLIGILVFAGFWGLWNGRVGWRYFQFFLAFTITVGALAGASVAYMGGLDYHREYAEKIGLHNRQISPWRVGFKYLFIAEWTKDEVRQTPADVSFQSTLIDKWQRNFNWFQEEISERSEETGFLTAVESALKENKPFTKSILYNENTDVWWSIIGVMLAISFFLVWGLKDHEALAWSFVPVFFMVAPTYYYYIMLVIPMLFFSLHLHRPTRLIGVLALLAMALPGYYMYGDMGWRQQFPTYYYHSLMYFLVVLYMMVLAGADSLAEFMRKLYHTFRPKKTVPAPENVRTAPAGAAVARQA